MFRRIDGREFGDGALGEILGYCAIVVVGGHLGYGFTPCWTWAEAVVRGHSKPIQDADEVLEVIHAVTLHIAGAVEAEPCLLLRREFIAR